MWVVQAWLHNICANSSLQPMYTTHPKTSKRLKMINCNGTTKTNVQPWQQQKKSNYTAYTLITKLKHESKVFVTFFFGASLYRTL